MIKILIADDEDFIRHGMRYAIPWEDNGMEVIGEAGNGEEALQLAVRLRPDIVLADIQMPLMDGLELAQRLRELLPETRVVILTAYGNTENLTSAIDVKVSAFLLKSADSKKILESVIKVKKEVEAAQASSHKVSQLKDIYEENRHLIKGTLLSRFLQNQVSYSYFAKKAGKIGLELFASSYALALIRTDSTDEKLVLGSLIQHFLRFQPFAFFIRDHHAIVILNTEEYPLDRNAMDDILPGILPVTFGNSIVVMRDITSPEEFPLVYTVLTQALEHCFWNTGQPYTLLTPEQRFSSDPEIQPYTYESQLITAILSRDSRKIQQQLHTYYSYMEEHKCSRLLFLESVKRLAVLLGAVSEDTADILKINALMEELETPREIMDLIASLALPSKTEHPAHSQIAPALHYIHQHYTEDIHLEDAAGAAYLSPGYLSRIFKAETGYSFKEYIHRLRIQKAQDLVCGTDLKYYEIAEQVGYKDYKYFSAYFSKIAGCSAKEYRNTHSRSSI